MKRYILLGIGIGIIFTNIVLSFVHGNKVDIDKIVEAEVQKRLKNIETYQQVEESFKEVVKDSEKNEEKLLEEEPLVTTSEAISKEAEKKIEVEKKKFFSGDKGKNATNYIFVYHSNVEKNLLKIKNNLSDLLDTKIEVRGDKAYLFSKYPYNGDNAKEILNIIKNDYNLKVKITTIQDIKRLLNPPTVKESMKSEENKEVVSKTKQNEEVKQEANGTAIKETTLKKVESELVQKVEEIKESAQ